MSFVRVPPWVVLGCVFVVLGLSATPPVLAQGGPPVINLGGIRAIVEGDWLAYSQWESFRGEDLNGDGDTEDSVVHVSEAARPGSRPLPEPEKPSPLTEETENRQLLNTSW